MARAGLGRGIKTMGRVDVDKAMGREDVNKAKMNKVAAYRDWRPTAEEIFSDDASLEKKAFSLGVFNSQDPNFKQGLNQGLGMAAAGLAATTALASGHALYGVAKDYFDGRKYDEALRTAIQMSPTLQRQGYDNLKGYMPMVAKASPTVAKEPRLLANYLETMIDAGGNLNLATFAEIANLENTLTKNNDSRNTVGTTLMNTAVKGIAENGAHVIANNISKNWGKNQLPPQQSLF